MVEASAVMLARKGPGGEVALDALPRRPGVEVGPGRDQAPWYPYRGVACSKRSFPCQKGQWGHSPPSG
jgi:hypothetical protein